MSYKSMSTCKPDSPRAIWLTATAVGLLIASVSMAASSQLVLAPPNLAPDDQFGFSVAASGNLMVVGAPALGFPATSSGSAYVYQRNGSAWTLQARLAPSFGLPGDAFGTSVAIDGNTIAVGAPGDNTFGHVYIFVNMNGVWVQQPDVLHASDNFLFGNFGASLSMSKDTIAVGAPFTRQGAVYVFIHSSVTGFWDPQGKPLVPADAGLSLGNSVSIVGDTIVAGAPRTGNFTGAAYVFNRSAGVWNQTALLAPSPALTNFGWSTAMTSNTMVVGAPDGNIPGGPGAAFVYTLSNNVWTLQSKLQGNASGRALLGWSVGANGNTLALGAPADASFGFTGGTYVYTGGGANWQLVSQQAPANGTVSQLFGYSVAVIDGNTTAEGSPWVGTPASPRTGAVYVTQR